jgi:hypothetical protein
MLFKQVRCFEQTPNDFLADRIEHGDKYTSIMVNAPICSEYPLGKARILGAIDVHDSLSSESGLSGALKAAQEFL